MRLIVKLFGAPLAFLFVLLFSGCSSPKEKQEVQEPAVSTVERRDPKNFSSDCRKLRARALEMDSILLRQMETNDTLGARAIKAFTDYAYYCHSDSMSPVYLIKSAQVARAINNLPQARKSLEYCISEFRDFRDRPAAIFLLAQLFEDKTFMNDRDEAQRLYGQIINEYPDSPWALSAKGALTMLGKSDEEIIKMLKNKN